MLKFAELKDVILNNNRFVITTHVNPDADAIGSEMALYYILKKLDKEVLLLNHSSTPYNLQFLDPDGIIKTSKENKIETNTLEDMDVLIVLDLNDLNRTVSLENLFRNFNGYKICIDHHQDPEGFEKLSLIDTSYSSTGAIIYDFIEKTKIVEIDLDIANNLYAAIMTDTGSFRFERTTGYTHRIVAKLLDLGVNSKYIYDQIYEQNNFSRTKLLGFALESMKQIADGQIVYMRITQDMLTKTNAIESEVDGFVNYCLTIKDSKIGILFFELNDGLKISFRSRGNIPVNELAANFRGGGHFNASGARLFNADFDGCIEQVLLKAEEYLKNN